MTTVYFTVIIVSVLINSALFFLGYRQGFQAGKEEGTSSATRSMELLSRFQRKSLT